MSANTQTAPQSRSATFALWDKQSKVSPTTIAGLVGIVGILLTIAGLCIDLAHGHGRVGQSWLIGWGFGMAILIGMLFLTQITYLFDAGWAVVLRRQWENAFSAFFWMGLLLIPVVVLPFIIGKDGAPNPGAIWKWMNPEYIVPGVHPTPVDQDPLWIHKSGLLNVPFFIIRLVIYFVVFCGLGALLRRYSFRNDTAPDGANWGACRKISAVGIPLTAFATTFMAFDLFMSLSYHWFSTMYGVWFFTVCMRAGLAGSVILCNIAAVRGWLGGLYNNSHNYFLACLCLAFTVFWAYISFSQYFLIYNANIPEETFWYNMREMTLDGSKSSWWWVSMALIFGYFVIPFLILLWHNTKVIRARLIAICLWILGFTILDLYFNILPKPFKADNALGYTVQQFVPVWTDLTMLIGVIGVVVWALLRSAARHEPVPINDPRIKESIYASK